MQVTLAYLGGYRQTATLFGMSKQTAVRLVSKMLSAIKKSAEEFIRMPVFDELDVLESHLRLVSGFPGAVLAVDGTLVEIERPADFEGWYCRKGYPAVNIQVVVDYRKRIRSFSIRPGSSNDQSVFNRSIFAQDLPDLLKDTEYHVLGDAGYKILHYLLVPYEITSVMSRADATYNYKHSKTRIVVEMAIGLLKGRFRRLKSAINQKDSDSVVKVIVAAFVLHNLLIDVYDRVPIIAEPDHDDVNHPDRQSYSETISSAILKRDRIRSMLMNEVF